MLRARRLPGKVEYIPYLDTRTGSHAHLFKVSGAPVPICNVTFTGVEPALLGQVRDAAAPLLGRDYSRIGSTDFLRATLVPFYRRLGHLRMQLSGINGRIGESGSKCAGRAVVSATVHEGAVYWWKGAVWTGARTVTTKELDAALGMKGGEVADGTKIDRGVQAVVSAYGRRGYLTARAVLAPQFDDLRHSVVFVMSIVEGPQFRMGELIVTGVPDSAASRLKSRWALKPGDVYDAGYPAAFMSELRKNEPQLLSQLGAMRASVKADPTTRAVQVTLAFGG